MKTPDTETAAVIGLGTMGYGIVQNFAAAGYITFAFDQNAPARDTLTERIRKSLHDFVASGLTHPSEIETILSRVRVVDTEAEAVAGAGVVTEAVAEDLAIKRELFQRLEDVAPGHAIFASNSSTFPISQTAEGLKRPERAIVTHYFNPSQIIPLVEVVPGPLTSEAVTQKTMEMMRRLGKIAVKVEREIPGFIVNRIQMAANREIWNLVSQGVADPKSIDAAVTASMGFRLSAMGPLAVHDLGGLDILARVFENLAPELENSTTVPSVIKYLVSSGNYGVKTGQGFFSYGESSGPESLSQPNQRLLDVLKLHRGWNAS